MEDQTDLLRFALELVSAQHRPYRACVRAEGRERSCRKDIGIRRKRLEISEHAGHAEIFGKGIMRRRTRQNAGYALAPR